ncbi:MAG TPA: RNA-binding protein [Polyangiaceae bacterium]|nr:RNA-binding protein [Polyangiaceae bacterium]
MTCRLYVGNLSYDTTSESLRSAFVRYGEIVDLHVMVDRYSGRPRGFAFVTMASREQAARAVAGLNGMVLDGRALRVSETQMRPPNDDGLRKR